MTNAVVGLDIGSSSLRAAEVSYAGKKRPTLVRFHEVALPKGAVGRGEVLEAEVVASALKQLWSKGGFSTKKVVLGIGNQRVISRDLSVPKMSLRRIRESLPFHVQNLLPMPVDEALLDFYPVSESIGENGAVVNGLLIAAVKKSVLANIHAVQLAGLTPVEVDLIPFALARALLNSAEPSGTTAVIDVGASTTIVLIAKDGVPQFVRIIPAGCNDLSEALVTRLEITPERAEDVKRSLGLATQVSSEEEERSVAIIFELANELLTSLRNTVKYFVNTRPEIPVGRIVLTGGGAELSGFAAGLAELTRIPVVAGDPLASVSLARGLRSADLSHSASSLSVALGLALRTSA